MNTRSVLRMLLLFNPGSWRILNCADASVAYGYAMSRNKKE
jgi:hypothetical protein